jgi:hypothetical protein
LENNIKMDLREAEFEVFVWINLGQDRDRRQTFVNVVINFGVP